MKRLQLLLCLCAVFISQRRFARGDTVFLSGQEGASASLPCRADPAGPAPVAVYLRRTWLDPADVLYMYTRSKSSADRRRLTVAGDPADRQVNVTLAGLLPSDTDRYHCQFVVENPLSEDHVVPGLTDFFLHVSPDAAGSVDVVRVEAPAGGVAVLPCLPPHGEGGAVGQVSLRRQKDGAPVEELYHMDLRATSSPLMSSVLPPERVRLTSVAEGGGVSYSLTLKQLQVEDSALYSCQLILPDSPHSRSSLGRRVFFLSVHGERCGCSSYSLLLYALSAAVGVLLLLLLVLAIVYRSKARQAVKRQPAAPIYEEMVGVQTISHKMDAQATEYSNFLAKTSCPENHYETPTPTVARK